MQNTDSITGKVIGISKSSGSYDVALKTGSGVVKVKLSSSKMGLGSVDEAGNTRSIIKMRSSEGWIPTSLVNPSRIVGREVDVFGTPFNGVKGNYIDRPKSFRIR